MSKRIMLRGNSGSGKTTVAKELQKNHGKGIQRHIHVSEEKQVDS